MSLIAELAARESEIIKRFKELEGYINEKDRLGAEIDNIRALLHIARKRVGTTGMEATVDHSPPVSRSQNGQKKISKGHAEDAYKVLLEEARPLTLHEICVRLSAKGITANSNTLGVAVRRNLDFFDQEDRTHWRIKRQPEL